MTEDSKYHWDMIPTHCLHMNLKYRILSIDMQAGTFDLYNCDYMNPFIENVDMYECYPCDENNKNE